MKVYSRLKLHNDARFVFAGNSKIQNCSERKHIENIQSVMLFVINIWYVKQFSTCSSVLQLQKYDTIVKYEHTTLFYKNTTLFWIKIRSLITIN